MDCLHAFVVDTEIGVHDMVAVVQGGRMVYVGNTHNHHGHGVKNCVVHDQDWGVVDRMDMVRIPGWVVVPLCGNVCLVEKKVAVEPVVLVHVEQGVLVEECCVIDGVQKG